MRRAAAALAALALVVAGCGDDLEEFRGDLRPLEDRAQEQRAVIAAELRTATLGSRSDAEALRRDTAALAETFEEIEQLEPPGDYEEPFAAYVRANDEIVRNLDRFAAAVAAGRVGGLRTASRAVVADLGRSQSSRLRWLE